jgi:hemin uptake protein HemP
LIIQEKALIALRLRRIGSRQLIRNQEKIEVQSDGRIRKWARIPEVGKFLRVILLDDGETVHNAFLGFLMRSKP